MDINNLTSIDSSSIYENTPMVLITKGGKSIAIPAYVYKGSDSSDQSANDLYECVLCDYGEVIPAHNNIVIQGITSSVNSNGEYIQTVPTAVGMDRVWKYGDYYCGFDKAEKRWVVSINAPSYENALFYSPAGIFTSEDGTKANPKLWSSIVSADSNKQTQVFNTADSKAGSSENYRTYIYVKLLGGVNYTIGMTNEDGQDNRIYLYDDTGSEVTNNDDMGFDIDGVYCKDTINFTPSADGIFIIGAGAYSTGTGNTKVVCSPDPEPVLVSVANPWDVSEWHAGTGSGTPIITNINVDEEELPTIWSGYKLEWREGGSSPSGWYKTDTLTENLEVKGYYPAPGRIYNDNTTVWFKDLYVNTDPKMVLLCHFEESGDSKYFMDSTDTCFCQMGSSVYKATDQYKFGTQSAKTCGLTESGYTSYGIKLTGLPKLDAFTIEWWQYGLKPSTINYGDGGYVLFQTNSDNSKSSYLPTIGIPPEDAIINEWKHYAFTRDTGSSTVSVYINGSKVGNINYPDSIGGDMTVYISSTADYNGSASASKYIDEYAIFNYMKYTGNFTPPSEPYADVISGLNISNNPVRDVRVSKCICRFVNDSSYALKDPTATGSNRVWETYDGKYQIMYDNMMYYQWVVCDTHDSTDWNAQFTVYATIPTNYDEDHTSDTFNPIGYDGWKDNFTSKKIKVVTSDTPEEPEVVDNAIGIRVTDTVYDASGDYILAQGSEGSGREFIHVADSLRMIVYKGVSWQIWDPMANVLFSVEGTGEETIAEICALDWGAGITCEAIEE